MKPLLVLIVGLMAIGCATTPTMKSVAGTYNATFDGDTGNLVLLKNGTVESYKNGKKIEEGKWKLVGKEVHAIDKRMTGVFKINPMVT